MAKCTDRDVGRPEFISGPRPSILRGLGLKGSTIAVYVNGVLSVSAFACAARVGEEGELCPTHELLALRKQAEDISKQERLFEAKHPAWLSWEDAQKARVACVEKYNATSAEQKKALQYYLGGCMVALAKTRSRFGLATRQTTQNADLADLADLCSVLNPVRCRTGCRGEVRPGILRGQRLREVHLCGKSL